MAIVVAVGIGVAFGVYPAGRAAKLPPDRCPAQRMNVSLHANVLIKQTKEGP